MASIFQEVSIGWRGAEYRITPTMRVLNRIEQDVSLAVLASRISSGDVPISHLAMAVAALLKEAGASATAEEVYESMVSGDPESIRDMATAIILAAFPVKKSEAEQPTVAPKKSTPARKRRT